MKTPNSTPKNIKTCILVCMILLTISTSVFSQNKLVSIVTSINPNFAIPVACVFGLAIFLFSAFMKQKKH
jgi:H+/Cl- antiporter ClcA